LIIPLKAAAFPHKKTSSLQSWFHAAFAVLSKNKKVLNHHSSKWVFAKTFMSVLPAEPAEACQSRFNVKLPITA
jgi:hypothetical protein